MSISQIIIGIFLSAIILLIIGIVKKNKVLKRMAIIAFIISIGLFLLVWYALGYM